MFVKNDGEVEAGPIEPDELFARMVSLENEAVQARQRQASARQSLAAAQQHIQQLYLGGSAS